MLWKDFEVSFRGMILVPPLVCLKGILRRDFSKGIFEKGCLKRDVVEGFLGFVVGDDLDTPVGFFENGFRGRT